MAYDPTAAGDPVFNPSTNTAKCYANSPKNIDGGTVGHRLTQFLGRQIQVTTDDAKTSPRTGSTYTTMVKHSQ
jgi:hypothetical protein